MTFLLAIALSAIPECHPDAQGHETNRGNQENDNAFADGPLSILGSRFCRAVTHGARLTEGRRGPKRQANSKNGGAKCHLTPNFMMRNASGKKIIINARQATSEHMVSHFMREISYFMCMK